MKKFLLHIVLFSSVLLALAIGLDAYMTHNALKLRTSPFAFWSDLYQDNIHSDVLIMGNSRAYVQFNPAVLDTILHVNSYNLGMNGRAADSQIKKYHVYRHHGNPAPRLIIYEVSHGTIHKSIGYEREQFVPHLYDKYLWEIYREQENFSYAAHYLPCWRYVGWKSLKKSLLKSPEPGGKELYKGFYGFEKKWDGSGLAKMSCVTYSKDTAVWHQFQDFLTECKQDGIQVVLVISPFYIGGTEKMTDYEGMHKMYADLAREYDIPLLDYTFDEICYDTANFYNTEHLNRKGANQFSVKVAHAIDSLGVLPKR